VTSEFKEKIFDKIIIRHEFHWWKNHFTTFNRFSKNISLVVPQTTDSLQVKVAAPFNKKAYHRT